MSTCQQKGMRGKAWYYRCKSLQKEHGLNGLYGLTQDYFFRNLPHRYKGSIFFAPLCAFAPSWLNLSPAYFGFGTHVPLSSFQTHFILLPDILCSGALFL